MRSLTLLSLCLSVGAVLSSAQTPTTPAKCNDPDISTVDSFGPEIASNARGFVVDLQQAVRSNDREAVASMMHYPLRSTKNQIRTKAEFLKHYDELWTDNVKRALLAEDIACLTYASNGFTPENGSQTDFVIGNGEVWFDAIDKSDPMKVITINN